MVFEGLPDGASRLTGVGAVIVFTVMAVSEYFREKMAHLVSVKFEGAESFYPRSVYQSGAVLKPGYIEHLGECRSVHSRVVG